MSDAAHELKTAVAVVKSSVQLIGVRSRTADEYQGGLDRVLDDNQRVEDLVTRMLTLARTNEGTAILQGNTEVDVEIRSALAAISTYAEAKGVLVESGIDAHLHVRMAPGELRRSFPTWS